MGGTTRQQEYPYQFKTLAVKNARDCGQGMTINMSLPTNILAIKNIFVHCRIQFDAAEPVLNQKIDGIGSPTYPYEGAQPKMKPLALVADGNREIDLKQDLTDMIGTLQVYPPAAYSQGYISIGIHHPIILAQLATIKICKIDIVYTTQGIR